MSLRKTQGAILCPGCKRLIDADEPACPHCGLRAPGLFGFGHLLSAWFGGGTDLVAHIVLACVALYGATLALDWRGIGGMGFLSLLSPSTSALYTFGMTGGLAWRLGHWWTLATYVFLHGGLLHLAFNMMWLRTLGATVVEELGAARFVVVFVGTGILAGLVSNLWGELAGGGAPPTIGASGGIFGLMGLLLIYGRRRGGAWGRALAQRVAGWALFAFVFGFVLPGVNNAAHLGGALAGMGMGLVMPRFERSTQGAAVQLLAVALLGGSALGVLASVFLMWPRLFG